MGVVVAGAEQQVQALEEIDVEHHAEARLGVPAQAIGRRRGARRVRAVLELVPEARVRDQRAFAGHDVVAEVPVAARALDRRLGEPIVQRAEHVDRRATAAGSPPGMRRVIVNLSSMTH